MSKQRTTEPNTVTNVTIEDMMDCREKRASLQEQYRREFHSTVISFCMNIPGPIKTNPQIRHAFSQGAHALVSSLHDKKLRIRAMTEIHEATGDELILCVDGDASLIKKLTSTIEESHPLGRLFDMDVIDSSGTKLSRNTFRTCILCNCQAQECARSRKHSVEEMFGKIMEMIAENS